MRHYVLPRLQDFIFIIVLLSALLVGPRMLNIDSDLGRHLTLGRYILASRQIPTVDLLSFTKAGASRPPYEWLSQVTLALAYRILALDGVVLLAALVIASAFAFVYVDSVNRSHAPLIALFMTIWAAASSSLHWLARPHVFSFLFFALWVAWLDRLRRGEQISIWFFPALMLLWSNAHGGFVFGFLAWAAYLAGWWVDTLLKRGDRGLGPKLLLVGMASLIASFITPDLWHNWDAVLNNRSSYILSRTVETMPLQIASRAVWPFIAMLVLAAILTAWHGWRQPAGPVILLAGLAAASIVVVRNIPLFAIAAAPLLTERVGELLRRTSFWQHLEDRFMELDAGLKGLSWSALVVVLALAFFAYRNMSLQVPVFGFSSAVFPVEAANWVKVHPQSGPMFNDFDWGGYLLYRFWPAHKVFIDSQSDFYGEALTRETAEIAQGSPSWEATLARHGVSWMLVPLHSGLAESARLTPAWAIAYEDNLAIILVRR